MLGSSDPVDSGVVSDGIMSWVHENDLIVLVDTVLADPIAVQDSESSKSSPNSFLGLWSKISCWLELVDTDWGGLSADNTPVHWSLSASSSDPNSVDNEAILGLIAEFSGLVGSGGVINTGDDGELSVLPGPNSHKESHDVTLLLAPKFFQILVDTHLWLKIL